MSEFELRRDAERAAHAQRLIEDELLKEAFAEIEARLIEGWKGSDARDDEGRKRLWQAVQLLGKLQSYLQEVVNTGKLSQAALNDIAERRQKRFGIV